MTMDLLKGLNKSQIEAVEKVTGPVLIVAGPGSGKTRVITHRIAYLIQVCGVNPRRIMAATFTNKAANEMKSRLHDLVPGQAHSLTVGTFHSFCANVLRKDGEYIGLNTFTIYDDEDQLKLLKQAMEKADIDPRRFSRRAVQSAISKAKSLLLDARAYSLKAANYFEQTVAGIYESYQTLLERNKAVDFDDLLFMVVQLFKVFPETLGNYQNRFVHILIDEFQDTNIAQYELANMLAGVHRNICVVGDPDQSIYSWRNADLRNIISFQKNYPDAKVINLEENYRSTQNILGAAKHLISSNSMRLDKDLFTHKGNGHKIVIHEAFNAEEEALFVIEEVARLSREEGLKPNNFAVTYRTNAQSRAFEEACLRYGMKYKLVGGIRFYRRREVKDIIAYLRLLFNRDDEISLLRILNVPSRSIGQRSLQELLRWCQQNGITVYEGLKHVSQTYGDNNLKPALTSRAIHAMTGFVTMLDDLITASHKINVVTLLEMLLEKLQYQKYLRQTFDSPEERWENIMELRAVAQEFHDHSPPDGLIMLLERMALVSDIDDYDEQSDAFTLITLHQIKGLEFPVVFIAGLEEGLLPHSRSMDTLEEMEEERRLCYVGMTRAQERLYLLRSFRRTMMGSSGPTLPSRFLGEVPEHLATYPSSKKEIHVEPKTYASNNKSATVSIDLNLKDGDKVHHNTFGKGVVVSCVPSGNDYEITVVFNGDAGIKKLLYSFAGLEKVQ